MSVCPHLGGDGGLPGQVQLGGYPAKFSQGRGTPARGYLGTPLPEQVRSWGVSQPGGYPGPPWSGQIPEVPQLGGVPMYPPSQVRSQGYPSWGVPRQGVPQLGATPAGRVPGYPQQVSSQGATPTGWYSLPWGTWVPLARSGLGEVPQPQTPPPLCPFTPLRPLCTLRCPPRRATW